MIKYIPLGYYFIKKEQEEPNQPFKPLMKRKRTLPNFNSEFFISDFD